MTPGHSIESHGVLENYNLYNFALEKHTFSYNLTQVTVALGNRFVSILRTSNIMFPTVQYSTVQYSTVYFEAGFLFAKHHRPTKDLGFSVSVKFAL